VASRLGLVPDVREVVARHLGADLTDAAVNNGGDEGARDWIAEGMVSDAFVALACHTRQAAADLGHSTVSQLRRSVHRNAACPVVSSSCGILP
jgi:hypothetical protein